jgi:hypothetical protein
LQTADFYLNFFSFLLKLNLIIIRRLRLNDDQVLAFIRCLAGALSGNALPVNESPACALSVPKRQKWPEIVIMGKYEIWKRAGWPTANENEW